MKSVHFPPMSTIVDKNRRPSTIVDDARAVADRSQADLEANLEEYKQVSRLMGFENQTAFDLLRDSLRESKLIRTTLSKLLESSDRHGDLQVARSAAFRLLEKLNSLIDQSK